MNVENPKQNIIRFEPLMKPIPKSKKNVVDSRSVEIAILKGSSGNSKVPVYDDGGELIGHNIVENDMTDVRIKAKQIIFSDGSTALF